MASVYFLYQLVFLFYLKQLNFVHQPEGKQPTGSQQHSTAQQHKAHIGFSADLIHHDSPLSPYYNTSETNIDRQRNAVLRSIWRVNHLQAKSTQDIQADLKTGVAEYFIEYSIGNPVLKQLATADTGSDLTWTQDVNCEKPKNQCFDQTPPKYDESKSSTLIKVSNQDKAYCTEALLGGLKSAIGRSCGYKIEYGDGSFSKGYISRETITIGSSTFQNFVFGRAINTKGEAFRKEETGVFGLGPGPVSLISQFGFKTFSYCLLPPSYKNPSKINFGASGLVSGPGVTSTPLFINGDDKRYRLRLKSLTVGKQKKLLYPTPANPNEGNIIIDLGSTNSFLDRNYFQKLTESLKIEMKSEPVPDPDNFRRICFKVEARKTLPDITVEFEGDANFKLNPQSAFEVAKGKISCFSMISETGNGLTLFGNINQRNMLIGYDIPGKKLNFKPVSAFACTN